MILNDYLNTLDYSKKELKSLLQNGKVYYHGVPTADDRREIDPQFVELRPRGPRITPGRDPAIVFKDNTLVVVYKPAGYLSVRAAGRHKDPNIMGFVHRICGNAFPVHRLDEDTSGLMLVALTESAQSDLKAQLEARTIERIYLTIAAGRLSEAMTVDSILTRNRGDGRRGTTDRERSHQDKRAISHFTPLENLHKATLIQAKLQTGRTHQIRIHLSENELPVLGDQLYSPPKVQKLAPRLALHAHTLTFSHPKTAQKLSFTAPLADDLERLRRQLARR